MSDVLEVEQEISRVRGEIEGMEAEQDGLEHRVGICDRRSSNRGRISCATRRSFAWEPAAKCRRQRISGCGGYHHGNSVFSLTYGPALLVWLAILILPGRFVMEAIAESGTFKRVTVGGRS